MHLPVPSFTLGSPLLLPPTAPAQASPARPEEYTVITRGVIFHLSRGQIESDSPNYFTAAFLEHDFAEAQTKVLYLDRHPQLFACIVEHLSGYIILPLHPKAVPETMTVWQATENLRADANYFDLKKLLRRLDPLSATFSGGLSPDVRRCYTDYQYLIDRHHMKPEAALKLVEVAQAKEP